MSVARRIFSWRTLRVLLFLFVALVTCVALLVAFENWRGKRAWLKFKAEWEAKGEVFDAVGVIPPKVPDNQNFAATPLFAALFDYEYAPSVIYNNSNALLRSRSVVLSGNGKAPRISDRAAGKPTDLGAWRAYLSSNSATLNPDQRLVTSSATNAEDLMRALAKFDETLKELHDAASRPDSVFPVHYHENISALLPHLAVLRSVSDIVRLRAVAQWEQGRAAEAFSDLKLAFRLGESLKAEPLLVSQLVRFSLLESALDTVWETLGRWSDEQLVELQRIVSAIEVLDDYPRSIRGERALINDVFVRMRQGEHFPDDLGRIARHAPSGFLYHNQLALNRLHQKYSFAPVDLEQRRVDPKAAFVMDEVPELKRRHPYRIFVQLLFPALGKAVQRFAKTQTDLDLAKLACALERYRRANGTYPKELEALVPHFVERLPHDIISGGTLKYRQTAPEGFVLYSVGFDERDNQGQGQAKGERSGNYDWVWKPVTTTAPVSADR
jgi:hypothetical protein